MAKSEIGFNRNLLECIWLYTLSVFPPFHFASRKNFAANLSAGHTLWL